MMTLLPFDISGVLGAISSGGSITPPPPPPPDDYDLSTQSTTIAWWDAQPGNSNIAVADGKIAAWGDETGTYTLTQETSDLRPIRNTDSAGFTGSQFLDITSRLGLGQSDFQLTLLVSATTGRFGSRRFASLGDRIVGSSDGTVYWFGSKRDTSIDYSSTGTVTGPSMPGDSKSLTVFVKPLGPITTNTIRIDGSTQAVTSGTGTPIGNDVDRFTMSAQSAFFFGDISGMALLSSVNLTDIQKAEGFMAHRYGTQSALPTNHPYKLSPP